MNTTLSPPNLACFFKRRCLLGGERGKLSVIFALLGDILSPKSAKITKKEARSVGEQAFWEANTAQNVIVVIKKKGQTT